MADIKNVYIAGPMRGIKDFNFPAFDNAAAWLRLQGHSVFNPAEHDRKVHGDVFKSETGDNADVAGAGFDLRDALYADTEYITQHADAICVLEGWSFSKGACAEVALAEALGLPVIQLRDWPTAFNPLVEKPTEEIRSVSSTGGEKGTKLARYDLIPAEPLRLLAEHFGRGARKYADRNWERGYEWSKTFAALNRHLWQWWGGEDIDAETGSSHMVAVAWHAFVLLQFLASHPEFDDRPKELTHA